MIGDGNLPQCQVQDWSDIVSIAASGDSTYGLLSDGTVAHSGNFVPEPFSVGGIKAITAGTEHNAVLYSDGTATIAAYDAWQVHIEKWNQIKSISSSGWHTVGLRENGTVVAIGNNEEGQCNVGSWNHIISILATVPFTIGVRDDGRVLITGDPDAPGFDYDLRRAFRKIKRDIESWRDVEELADISFCLAARHKDGSISFTKPAFKLNVVSLFLIPRLERALKKIFE